jgi:hypothetical protein
MVMHAYRRLMRTTLNFNINIDINIITITITITSTARVYEDHALVAAITTSCYVSFNDATIRT